MYVLFSGILVILALLFLTPYFSFIPRAALAAIIIAAVIFMVEVRVVKPMWRTKSKKIRFHKCEEYQINLGYITNELYLRVSESDLIPGVGTFIACLVLQLEIGILCGIGINILFILYHAARPKITVEKLKVIVYDLLKKKKKICLYFSHRFV